ncbi:MAG: recombinase family protein, partial [Chloroflexi bacterium]|nr:recombinase family protein [Chloroflexota bacterium]
MKEADTKVALYARVSSTAQDVDLSIGGQLNALRRFALDRGFEIIEEYVDEAVSGRTANRPVFQQMIGDARARPARFNAVLVWKLSRFARNREDSIVYKGMLRRHGIEVISITEPVEQTPAGQMMEGIIETVDEFYSASMGQDITRGMREAASRGFWVASMTPYGYKRTKVQDGPKQRTKLTLNTDTYGIAKTIFDLAMGGLGTKEIAKRLNQDGIPSPAGKRWGRGRVYGILTNPVYKGTLVFGKKGEYHRKTGLDPIIVDEAMPEIISPKEFERIQSKLRARSP